MQKARLGLSTYLKLADLIRSEYAEAKITDSAFSKYAAKVIGEPIGESSVALVRNALGIPSTKDTTNGNPALSLKALEARIEKLEAICRGLE